MNVKKILKKINKKVKSKRILKKKKVAYVVKKKPKPKHVSIYFREEFDNFLGGEI